MTELKDDTPGHDYNFRPTCGGDPIPWPSSPPLHLEPLYVLVLGPTGAGKSTIINLLTNNSAQLLVGHDHESCTTDVTWASVDHRERRITYFDTAGFGDTKRAPAEHLLTLIRRLDEMHGWAGGPRIHGVFYVHDINEKRMTQSTKTNLRVIEQLLGEHVLKNLVFLTNMWDSKPKDRHIRLEQDLMQRDEYFGTAIRLGAKAGAAYRICEDATPNKVQEALLDLFLDNGPEVLQIQNEVAGRDDLRIGDTGAGRALQEGLGEYVRNMEARLENLGEIPEGEQQNNLRGQLEVDLANARDQNVLLNAPMGLVRRVLAARFVAPAGAAIALGVAAAAVVPVVGVELAAGGTVVALGGLVACFRRWMYSESGN